MTRMQALLSSVSLRIAVADRLKTGYGRFPSTPRIALLFYVIATFPRQLLATLGRAYPTHKRIQSLGLHHEYSLDETLHVELPGAWHSGYASDEVPGLDAAVYLVMVAYEASLPSENAG